MDRLYSCMEPVHSKGKIRASGVCQRYGTSQVERCSKIIIIIEKFTKCSDRDLQKCVTTTHLAVLWILNSHLKLLIFFLVTYFLILKQTNMVNTEESCWLFFFCFFLNSSKITEWSRGVAGLSDLKRLPPNDRLVDHLPSSLVGISASSKVQHFPLRTWREVQVSLWFR